MCDDFLRVHQCVVCQSGVTYNKLGRIASPPEFVAVRGGIVFSRLLKNGASGRDPVLCGFCKCSHIFEYAALSKTPHALADGLMLVFQYPVRPRD
jgi:hypothetical protein